MSKISNVLIIQRQHQIEQKAKLSFLRRDADTILRSLHRAHCDQTAYPYPNYVKEYPFLVSYGKVSQNIKAVSGYGLKDLKPTNYDGDPAYFYIDFTSLEDKIDQNLETIAMDVNVQASTALNIWGADTHSQP